MPAISRTIAVAAVLAASALLPARAGENTVGLRAGYHTKNESPVAGLVYQYRFSSHFRLSPNIDYIFRNHDVDGLGVNLNVHFPFSVDLHSNRWNIYPLAGVSLTSWTSRLHAADFDGLDDDVTKRKTRFGLNTGCGLEFYATPTLKLSLEAKMNWVRSYSSGMFTLGIGYVF